MKKNLLTSLCMICAAVLMVSCGGSANAKNDNKNKSKEMKQYVKKYTNADYYKDGKLQGDVCLAAYKDMLEFYGVEWSESLGKEVWITDFELGDFENCGMAGVIWYNNPDFGYFGHDIYLLPGQMISEHRHVPTEFPAKHEAWKVNKGWVYNFSTGEATPNAPKLPASQKDHVQAKHFVVQKVDEVVELNELEKPHFLMAGDAGAIVTEYATYHDGSGLRFSNTDTEFTDILTKE